MNEDILRAVGFIKELNLVKEGKCPFCKKIINKDDFKDPSYEKEFNINGMCNTCQDNFFTK